MKPEVVAVPRPHWSPLPHEDCHDVEGKVLLLQDQVNLSILRFGPGGTIDEHSANIDVDVICLEGQGFTSLAGEAAVLKAGQSVRWPNGVAHRLWTEGGAMVTLMVEHNTSG